MTPENYGQLKVLCEQEVQRAFGSRSSVVRPGYIVGPHDPTGRFTYWPMRIARGGEVLAPGDPKRHIQFVDARDLAGFVVDLAESDTAGIFNATGPAEPLDSRSFLETCRSVVGSDATFTWVSDRFLEQSGVRPSAELPLWTPETPGTAGVGGVDCSRAIAAGLVFRPLAETVADTIDWARSQPDANAAGGNAIDGAKEAEILANWHKLTQPYRV